MRELPRRRVLQALAGLTAGAVAGCTAADESAPATSSRSTTGSTTAGASTTEPTTTESTTTTADEIAAEAWTVDSLDGEVTRLLLPNRPRTPETTGGPLYAGTTGGTVANVAVATGEVRWKSSVAGELERRGSPRVSADGGGLLVVSHTLNPETLRNYVEFLDPWTGDRKWTFDAREYLTPLGVVDDTAYLGGEYIRAPPSELGPNQDPTGEGRLHAVDLGTGEELWRTTVHSLVNATVARHGIYANVASADDPSYIDLVAFDHEGTERWRADAGRYHHPKPVASDDGIVAGVDTDSVAAIDPDGSERWRISAWEHGPSEIAATPDRIYVGARPLLAVSRTGDEHWRLDEYGDIIEPIRDQRREETLYFGGGTRVGAIHAGQGTARWSFSPEDEKYVHEQAIVDAGLLVNTGIDPKREFVLLDEMSGDVLGDFGTDESYWTATAVASRVFAGTTGGIYAFDVEP